MPADLDTAFDVAFWFCDQALNSNEYLQPQKLHRLMFLAQAYYVVAFEGRKLMPAVFVADEMGPLEPNVYRAFSRGRPDTDADLFIPGDIENFLHGIWGRFGHWPVERLTHLTKESDAYKQSFKRGNRAEIPLDTMRLSFTRADKAPAAAQVVNPKVMVTQEGRPVKVKSWVPGTKPK